MNVGIWIRSQNGIALCNAQDIWIDGEGVYANPNNYQGCGRFDLGQYFTEAEAVLVLGMIQERITHIERVKLMPSCDWETPSIIFPMPEAGFSGPESRSCDTCGNMVPINTYRSLDGVCPLCKEGL
jgi:hypothetical protein